MPHATFIWAAYGLAAVVLAWCALAPVLRSRKMTAALRQRHSTPEPDHAPQA